MITAGLLLGALGVLAWPIGSPGRDARARVVGSAGRSTSPRDPEGENGQERRDRLLAPVAGAGCAVVAVALLGWPIGALAAVILGPGAAIGTEWLCRRPRTLPPDRSLALSLDLVAAVLRSGRPLESALASGGAAASPAAAAAFTRVARLLELGADPRTAWSSCAPRGSVLEPVAAVAVRSHASGIKLADAFERLAGELRAECAATAAARANKAGIRAMGPLAACFLPSFVCLGIVPVIVGLAVVATRTLG